MASGGTPGEHGGDLAAAGVAFPQAPGPWVDLSTGISPHSYPQIVLPATVLARLPEPARLAQLSTVAARAYGAPDAACVVATPGTQMALPHLYAARPAGQVAIVAPTYSGHAEAATLAGHAVTEVPDLAGLTAADIAVVVNPNNPDGRLVARKDLLALAAAMRARGGLLVVDEAFMDVAPPGHSLAGDVGQGGIVVLRSFGKFYGLAGLRLGFALAAPELARRLAAALGPWAVSGPALEYGLAALADTAWQEAARRRLVADGERLAAMLGGFGLTSTGTHLFRHLVLDEAWPLWRWLGERGILARRFTTRPRELRLGLPGSEAEWVRLQGALEDWSKGRRRAWRRKSA